MLKVPAKRCVEVKTIRTVDKAKQMLYLKLPKQKLKMCKREANITKPYSLKFNPMLKLKSGVKMKSKS